MPVAIDRIDHLVLTVQDVDRTLEFHSRVLGMEPITFAGGRYFRDPDGNLVEVSNYPA